MIVAKRMPVHTHSNWKSTDTYILTAYAQYEIPNFVSPNSIFFFNF